jgi:hypothetical protein
LEASLDGGEFGPIVHGHVGTSGGAMLGILAEVHLGPVFGFEPAGAHRSKSVVDVQHPIAEDVDQESRLGVGPCGRYAQVDMVEARHAPHCSQTAQ